MVIKCPHCSKETEASVPNCKHCGKELMSKKELFLILLVIVVIIGFIINAYRISDSKTNPAVKSNKKEIAACVYAHSRIEEMLKAPSTAKFPPCSSQRIVETSKNEYNFNGYVDSENSFGAMIRSRFDCNVKLINSDKSYVSCSAN